MKVLLEVLYLMGDRFEIVLAVSASVIVLTAAAAFIVLV
jgi:hypothetical protein